MCEQPKSCRYCDGSHQTGSRDCQETKRQWDVARIMATDRITKKEAFNRLEAGSFPKLQTKDKMDAKPFSAQERIEEARNPNSMANIIQRSQIQERVIEELREAYTKQEKFIKTVMTEMRRELPEQKWKMILKDYEAVTENGKS